MAANERDRDIFNAFVYLSDSLRAGHGIVDTMDVLVQSCTSFLPVAEAGVLLADDAGALHVVASTSERASDVEEAQLGATDGPCLEAFQQGALLEVPKLSEARDRWPEFVGVALSRGFTSVHAIPLHVRGTVIGCLNLFSTSSARLSDADSALAEALAQIAAISVVSQRTLDSHEAMTAQLSTALESRVVIEQAKGVVAHQYEIGMDEAFARLRIHARNSGSKLHDVAHQIVQRQLQI